MIWTTFLHALARDRELGGGRLALVDGEGSRSWGEVEARVLSLAGVLVEKGIGPGDRVALLAQNSAAFLEATYAVARVGAVLVPLNLRLTAREQGAVLGDAEVRLLLHGDALEGQAREAAQVAGAQLEGKPALEVIALEPILREPSTTNALPPAVARAADDPAQLYYTSGTTGRAKGVVLTQGNIVTHARNAIHELELAPTDRWAHIAPMFHLADAWATVAITQAGGVHMFLPRFDAEEALLLLEEQRITITNLVPMMLNAMARHRTAGERDLSSLRLLLSGGAPIAPALVREIEDVFGCTYAQTYGLTETSPYLAISLLDERHAELSADDQRAARARTGRPFHGVEVQVVDDSDREVPPDDSTVGEVRARGTTVTPGYWQRPEETAAALRGGWFYTGDLATRDCLGSLRIVDRKKDMILSGAECIYSTEVEAVLFEHLGVFEAAVFGVPDEKWGEAVNAAVVLKSGIVVEVEELRTFCRERLAGYKVPKVVHLMDELPRTGSGKVAKRLLRDRR
ncbi:MAG: fatty-acyl-CoA synthase [Planctomycetota bacterium]